MRFLLRSALCVGIVVFCTAASASSPYLVRVLVNERLPEVSVSSSGRAFALLRPFTLEKLNTVTADKLVIKVQPNGVEVNGVLYKIFGVVIASEKKNSLYVDGKRYRGMLQVVKNRSSLQLLSLIDIETYLEHVIGREMPYQWPKQALHAQAIVSRTYVVQRMLESRYADFDVYRSTQDQVADLNSPVRDSIREAVESTRGMVLLYRGEVFSAFFHSTCGGQTKKAAWFWNVPDIPPLQGVSCGQCSESPFYRWDKKFSLEEFKRMLKKASINVDTVDTVDIVEGREGNEMSINGRAKMSTYRLRTLVGDGYLKSPDFTVRDQDGTIRIAGKGWGHGAGMCQWGALSLAKQGKDAFFIVQYYYPGVEVGVLKE